MAEDIYQASLKYHSQGRPGKVEIQSTKPCATQRDLSLAYSPGVAEPCRRIADEPGLVYDYTNKGNLVAVVTNGTAVLGLGDIGPLGSKPVMEGKAVLFKKFADIDVFDIEINAKDPEAFIAAVEAIAPTFGGINIEDVKGPECFHIERELERRLDIPVFHDDQHGTAIISSAAFLNSCEILGRKPEEMRCVVNGAGAAGISVAKLLMKVGVKPEHMLVCDSKGVIYEGRPEGMNPQKAEVAAVTEARTLADALKGAHCFLGCSQGNVVSAEMLLSMAKDPVVFAMANPTPEIDYELAKATRSDVIMATGRSDYPNQVNNVLGFPFIFRGALDTAATHVTPEMQLAAVRALADLAKEPMPETVVRAYGGERFEFGREYLIPKPFDPRVLYWVSVAVAEAAMKSGVARKQIDLDEYRERLRRKVEAGRGLVSVPLSVARGKKARIVIPEAALPKLLSVAARSIEEGLAIPILLGPKAELVQAMEAAGVPEGSYETMDPASGEEHDRLLPLMKRARALDDVSDADLEQQLRTNHFVYGTLLTEAGICDGLLAASDRPYAQMVGPILQYATRRSGVSRVAGLHLMQLKDRRLFIADTALIVDPSAEELAQIAMRSCRLVDRLNITPRLAFVSYANFSRRHDTDISKLKRAYKIVREAMPELEIFSDVQADVALDPERYGELFGDKIPKRPANILVFPNLHAANAAFRLARVIGDATAIGPMLLGLRRPANAMARGSTEEEIMAMMAVTAYNAQRRRQEILEGRQTKVQSRDQLLSGRS
jgi:malate dehydrogenase (oxaloacetate-decarboxylating)(NADP+)